MTIIQRGGSFSFNVTIYTASPDQILQSAHRYLPFSMLFMFTMHRSPVTKPCRKAHKTGLQHNTVCRSVGSDGCLYANSGLKLLFFFFGACSDVATSTEKNDLTHVYLHLIFLNSSNY